MSTPGDPRPSGANQLEIKTPLHTMAAFGVGWVLLIGLGLPIFLLIWLARGPVRQECASWRKA